MQFLEILNVGSNNKVLCAKHIYNFYPIETFVILKKKWKLWKILKVSLLHKDNLMELVICKGL